MTSSLLAIDAGNTRTVLGLFKGSCLKTTWRLPSKPSSLGRLTKRLPSVSAVVVSIVVPSLRTTIVRIARKVSRRPPLFIRPTMKMPIRLRLRNCRIVGQDRIVNAAAAFAKFKCGLIVVDFGTATTCDVVTPQGDYIGGTISPGVGISNQALHDNTSLLPLVPIRKPSRAVGRNTIEAIRSGVYWGYVGLVEGLIDRIRREVRFPVKVIATGGLSSVIAKATRKIDAVDPDLTLKGLQKLHEWNAPRPTR